MTDVPIQADWEWRAYFLDQMATVYTKQADEMMREAIRYRGLAEQARKMRS